MEINTTIGELTDKIRSLNKPLDTPIKVIIKDDFQEKDTKITNSSNYPFLHSGFWAGRETPIDLADNHDKYLYDEE